MVNPDFVITGIQPPAKGSASLLDSRSLRWEIPQLGVSSSESAALEFQVRHVGSTSGLREVNQSIAYQDAEGNLVSFPTPAVSVDCDIVVCAEPCPTPADLTVKPCSDWVVADLGEVDLQSQGRVLDLSVTIKQVCPGRRVALAAILTEVDACGNEHRRGMKVLAVPAHSHPQCRDVLVKCIRFVVPEEGGPSCGAICTPAATGCASWPIPWTRITAVVRLRSQFSFRRYRKRRAADQVCRPLPGSIALFRSPG